MVGLQTLDLAIGVRVPASQPQEIKRLPGSLEFNIAPSAFHSARTRNINEIRCRSVLATANQAAVSLCSSISPSPSFDTTLSPHS